MKHPYNISTFHLQKTIEIMIVNILFVLFVLRDIGAEFRDGHFDLEFGKQITENPNATVQIQARSEIECTITCFQMETCWACSYNRLTKACFLDTSDGKSIQTEPSEMSVTATRKCLKESAMRDCSDLPKYCQSGVYTVQPMASVTFQVFCDMETDGGGWTVLQRRIDGSTDFYRGWTEYEHGFGNLTKELWLGNQIINQITTDGSFILRIDLADFEGNSRYAKYNNFSVGDAQSSYILHVSGYSGDAGDSFRYHDKMNFSTFDGNNNPSRENCAERSKGAWWYRNPLWYINCHRSNLNGLYLGGANTGFSQGINWQKWKGLSYSLKSTKMMIKRPIE